MIGPGPSYAPQHGLTSPESFEVKMRQIIIARLRHREAGVRGNQKLNDETVHESEIQQNIIIPAKMKQSKAKYNKKYR